MKLQWELLLFYLCINLAFGVVIALQVPGTSFINPAGPTVNATDYEQHFNSTEMVKGWKSSPFTGIPLIGDIYSGLDFFWQNFRFLVDGFPMLLDYVGNTYITDQSGLTAFNIITSVLTILNLVLIAAFVIEFISGRIFSD